MKTILVSIIAVFGLLLIYVSHLNSDTMKTSVNGLNTRTINIFRVGNCEYVEVINGTHPTSIEVIHKGDCSNPEHKIK